MQGKEDVVRQDGTETVAGPLEAAWGVIRTNLRRFGIADQARLVGRALWRKLAG